MHISPVREVVGLDAGRETVEKSVVREGLEIDLVTHDARKFSAAAEEERVRVGATLFSAAAAHDARPRGVEANRGRLRHAASTSHHYFGFAETQWGLFEKERPRRVKPLLYVYRVLLTGIRLMRTGRIEANLVTLNQEFKLPHMSDLIARKLAGPEQASLPDDEIGVPAAASTSVCGKVRWESAMQASSLPEVPTAKLALNDLLIRFRTGRARRSLGGKSEAAGGVMHEVWRSKWPSGKSLAAGVTNQISRTFRGCGLGLAQVGPASWEADSGSLGRNFFFAPLVFPPRFAKFSSLVVREECRCGCRNTPPCCGGCATPGSSNLPRGARPWLRA